MRQHNFKHYGTVAILNYNAEHYASVMGKSLLKLVLVVKMAASVLTWVELKGYDIKASTVGNCTIPQNI